MTREGTATLQNCGSDLAPCCTATHRCFSENAFGIARQQCCYLCDQEVSDTRVLICVLGRHGASIHYTRASTSDCTADVALAVQWQATTKVLAKSS